MSLSAKIETLLSNDHFITAQNLLQFSNQKNIKVQLIRYGFNHPNQVVCSFLAILKPTGQKSNLNHKLYGSAPICQIIQMERSGKYDILQLFPLGAFDETLTYDQFMDKVQKKPQQKNGNLYRRKIRARLVTKQKQQKKPLAKKPSQNSADAATNINKSTKSFNKQLVPQNSNAKPVKQNVNKMVNDTKSKKPELKVSQQQQLQQEQQMQKILNKNNIGRIQSEPVKTNTKQAVQSQNQSEILKKFNINPTQLKQINQQMKEQKQYTKQQAANTQQMQQQIKVQINQKVADLQIDQLQQYELYMQKKKLKQKQKEAQTKVENKNTNIINNKVGNKPTEKQFLNKTDAKPKSSNSQNNLTKVQSQTQVQSTKPAGKGTLFAYMVKK